MDRIKPIYLDYNATTPHSAEVVKAILPYLEEHFGNPSSSHWFGIKAREAVEEARSHGAGQERGLRPGTENVTEIVGLGKACEIAKRDLKENMAHMKETRDNLYEGLKTMGTDFKLNGHPEKRLPNTLNVSFRGVQANMLLSDVKGQVAASAGAGFKGLGAPQKKRDRIHKR